MNKLLKTISFLVLFLVSTVQASDNFYGFGAGMVLLDGLNRQWPANVCMTTDGNGAVIPISGGGGGSSTVTVNPNANGSVSNNASITTTASTFTVPANAVGFILEAESGNTANIRWSVGATATASVGTLAEPGRDTGYVPLAASISVIAISGTQSASVQWILK